LFFVRVILHLISRQAEDEVVSNPLSSIKAVSSTETLPTEPSAELHPEHTRERGEAVTREEMMKLFGNALRVR